MKRFRFDGVDLVENATGRWVRHEDHTARIAELEAERDRLRAENEALRVALAGIDYRACAALAGRESGGQE